MAKSVTNPDPLAALEARLAACEARLDVAERQIRHLPDPDAPRPVKQFFALPPQPASPTPPPADASNFKGKVYYGNSGRAQG
jgi:hypothetical protein